MSAALAETWAIGARVSTYLLAGVPAAALDASPSGKGRTVRDLFAHIHDVRLLWLKAARPDLMDGLEKVGSGSRADHAALAAALDASAAAIERLVADAAAGDGRVKGFKPHVTAFVGYLLSHDAHHRGQVAQALRLAGTPLDKKVSFGLWEWGVR
ncbi:DinB family protein [Luteitalea sp.]